MLFSISLLNLGKWMQLLNVLLLHVHWSVMLTRTSAWYQGQGLTSLPLVNIFWTPRFTFSSLRINSNYCTYSFKSTEVMYGMCVLWWNDNNTLIVVHSGCYEMPYNVVGENLLANFKEKCRRVKELVVNHDRDSQCTCFVWLSC